MRNIGQHKEQDPGFHLDLGNYARILWRKKYFLLVPLAIAFIVASVGVRFLVPEYEASSLIRIGNPNVPTSDAGQYVPGGRSNRDEKTKKQLETDLLGSSFLDDLIKKLGIDRDPEVIAKAEIAHQTYPALSTEELVFRRLRDFLKKRIKVDDEGGSATFRVSYSDPNPDACYVIADAITQLYIDTQRKQTVQSLNNVQTYTDEQLAVYKDRLDKSEKDLSDFQERIASTTVSTANPVNDKNVAVSEKVRNDLDLTVRASESTLDKIRSRIASALGNMPSSEPVARDPEVAKLANELGDRRESELLIQLSGEEHAVDPSMDPVVATQQALQRRLSQVTENAYDNVPPDYRPLLVEYFYQQIEVKAYRRKLQRIDNYIGQFRSQVALAPGQETELQRLKDEAERNRTVYNNLKESKQQASSLVDATSNPTLGTTVTVLEAPAKPVSPVRPDKVKILILCFLFGATVGAAGLLLTEFTDSSYRSVEDVEKQLGVRVLGTIPRVGNTRWVSETSRKRTVIWVAVCVTFVCVFISAFYFYGKSSREHLIDLNPSISKQTEAPR
ncbi:MAG TPA: GNVR domain-containing protein [Candidatus Krumholzibacteria bacterium]|nr:GNVR domain-containing protein [Candidatus Krumholzibacteria bacterium]